MQAEIIPRVPETECYICGNSEAKHLCHHCGRAMCTNHGPFTPPKSFRYFRRAENREYIDLAMEETVGGAEGAHCEYCNHYITSFEPTLYLLVLFGVVLIITGLFVESTWRATGYYVLGIALVGASIWAVFVEKLRSFDKMREQRPLFPVVGRFPSIVMNELLKGNLTLSSDGQYSVGSIQVSGNLDFLLELSRDDRERLKKYRNKYALPRGADLRFHAGFVALSETARLILEDRTSEEVNPIPLTGYVASQPFLNGSVLANERRWQHQYKYGLTLDTQATAGLPIQIVPTLLSEGDEWAIELSIQINDIINISSLSLPIVEELILIVPRSLGDIESHAPSAKVGPARNRMDLQVAWKNINLYKSVRGSIVMNEETFYIRFANSKVMEPNLEVTGHLLLRFEGVISNQGDVTYFSSLGTRSNEDVRTIEQTTIDLGFCFHLGGLCRRKFYSFANSIEQLTAIPGSETITRLVNAMSENNIYVQRVIENPPHVNRANAHIMNRHWVVAGRLYVRATPIDFRLVASGQEQYNKGFDRPHDGNTSFQITAQGTIISTNMQNDIETLHKDIAKLIHDTPRLKIDLNPRYQLREGRWGRLSGTIYNTGASEATSVKISSTNIRVRKTYTIDKLEPKSKAQFALSILPESHGDILIMIVAICQDGFGQLPPTQEWYEIYVEEKPGAQSINNQTIFTGSHTGPIYTGSSNLEDEQPPDDW